MAIETIFDYDVTDDEWRRLFWYPPLDRDEYLAIRGRSELGRLMDIYILFASRNDPRQEIYKEKILKIDPRQKYNLFYLDVLDE